MKINSDVYLNILWISDIHFKKDDFVTTTKGMEAYLDSFVEKCGNLNATEKFDYLLVSGDIASSGVEKDYKNFSKYILDRLLAVLSPAVKLLIIPGNHDVNRTAANPLVNGFLEIRTEKLDMKAKALKHKEYLEQHYAEFCDLFEPYTAHFEGHKNIPTHKSSLKDNKYLFGHVVDPRKKTIFVMVNTAWYSLGATFLQAYLHSDVFTLRTLLSKKRKKRVQDALVAIGSEYGNQITAYEIDTLLKEITELKTQLEMYPDYLVITVLHHPINWLGWSERIQFDSTDFHHLKSRTDLMLSGHEHVPVSHRREYMHDMDLLHIAAGCLISDKPDEYKETWFSTLEINVTKKNVQHKKYQYHGAGLWEGFAGDGSRRYPLNKKYGSHLSANRKDEIQLLLGDDQMRKMFIEKVYGVVLNGTGHFYDTEGNIYIYVRSLDYYASQVAQVKKIALGAAALRGDVKIYFIHLDLDLDATNSYFSTDNRLKTFGDIADSVDFHFDGFRRNIYSGLATAEAKLLQRVKMVASVFPYWFAESQMNEI